MNRSSIGSPPTVPQLSNRERLAFFLERTLDRRLAWVGVALYRLTGGRIARLYGKDVLVLTTCGRRTGRKRTVLLQYYARYFKRTSRTLPLVRLSPLAPDEAALS